MGNKNKQNGDAEHDLLKDGDVGAEVEETTDDEGGVDTPPPQKEEEEDAPTEDGTFEVEQIVDMECRRRWKCPVKFRVRWVGYSEKDDTWLPASELNCEDLIQEFLEISGRSFEFKGAMAPRKRPAEGGEMTMQTRKAMRFSYSELDEDQDEVMPAGTRTRKVKVRAEPRPPKPLTAKKRPAATHSRSIGRASHREPEEYEVQEIMDIRKVKGRTEYKVRWKRWSAKYDSWLPEEELNCPELMKRFNATIKNEEEEEEEEEEYEVEKILDQRQKKNKKEYLVQWKNKGPKHNSWEPEENVENCKQIIKKFNDSLKKKDKPVKEPKEPKEPKEAKEPKVRGKVKVAALVAVESSSRSRRTGKNRSYSQFYDQ